MKHGLPRRSLLKAMAGGLSALSAAGSLRAQEKASAISTEAQPLWSFEGVTGPEHWSELSPDYAPCQFGIEQSPIDLVDAIKVSSADALTLDYRPVTAHAVPNSWTLQIAFGAGCEIMIHRTAYVLDHMLVRHPSEHLLSGRALEMELQFCHRSGNGGLAMVSAFVRQGTKSEAFDTILASLPGNAAEKGAVFPINPLDLLPPAPEPPKTRTFYRYMGSLTTPPCSEGIVWTVFKNPVEASAKQIRDLATLFPANARPANKVNRRYLLEFGG